MKKSKWLNIGRYTYKYEHIHLQSYNNQISPITIGSFCSIAENLIILIGGEHDPTNISTFPFSFFEPEFKGDSSWVARVNKKGVIIENDVWIGLNTTIMSGRTIHNGAVIGSGSVVASDIPPYSIAVGNPCRVVKKRFSDDIIQELLKIQWWNWPIEKIKKYAYLLENNNTTEFLRVAGEEV